MPIILLILAAGVLILLALTGTVAGPWYIIGLPIIFIAGLFLMLRGAADESGGGAGSTPEPTGMPRSSAATNGSAAETANERVGQS